MLLATTTLIGPETLDLAEPALRSVAALADLCLLIPTDDSVSERDVKHCARRAGLRADQFEIVRFDWCDDFAAARNFALDEATLACAEWVLTLDTDERIEIAKASSVDDVRAKLAGERGNFDAFWISHASGAYSQARLVSLPCRIRFSGRTHEAFPAYQVRTAPLQELRFADEPKTPEQLEAKFRRDLRILEEETVAHPNETRWHFYLAETRNNLGDLPGAILAYDRCVELRGWNEEAAWACYQAANCLCKLEQFQAAIDRCALGLGRHPGVGELAWLAGYASYRMGRLEDAVAWSAMSSATSVFLGVGRAMKRIGFQHPPARFELPHELMSFAWEQLGRPDLAAVARAKMQHAKACRTGAKDMPQLSAAPPPGLPRMAPEPVAAEFVDEDDEELHDDEDEEAL